MRLFVAIEMPPAVVEEFKRLQTQIKGVACKPVSAFHLTLKFIGEVPDGKVGRIKEALSSISLLHFTATLTEVGVFPNPDYVNVVWAGLSGEGISELQHEVDAKLAGLGFGKDTRFVPHVTLARVKAMTDKAAFAKALKEMKPEQISFEVGEFKLIKSTLMREGPVYEDVAIFRSK